MLKNRLSNCAKGTVQEKPEGFKVISLEEGYEITTRNRRECCSPTFFTSDSESDQLGRHHILYNCEVRSLSSRSFDSKLLEQ